MSLNVSHPQQKAERVLDIIWPWLWPVYTIIVRCGGSVHVRGGMWWHSITEERVVV